jgi:methionine-rich copper-binding protein CopC
MTISRASLDNFHDTGTTQRADELAHAYVETINSADDAALDAVPARTFLSYSRGRAQPHSHHGILCGAP